MFLGRPSSLPRSLAPANAIHVARRRIVRGAKRQRTKSPPAYRPEAWMGGVLRVPARVGAPHASWVCLPNTQRPSALWTRRGRIRSGAGAKRFRNVYPAAGDGDDGVVEEDDGVDEDEDEDEDDGDGDGDRDGDDAMVPRALALRAAARTGHEHARQLGPGTGT
ncbi:hypothetical protein PMIN01_09026 [Paraphaeosphaeria minitans]|uniref:Uncharacterized protein n=1 Tax=Paraphaeosphaeria minitans TaxID=565426 RepID=A0A9P6KN87_9PLEO|nr:hypothetical protein PMIN01_09026 [Paraphaeosphaeria minitans]